RRSSFNHVIHISRSHVLTGSSCNDFSDRSFTHRDIALLILQSLGAHHADTHVDWLLEQRVPKWKFHSPGEVYSSIELLINCW
ncbi:hypothetical protein T265_14059, partial [Opisthorchis viverrini]